MLELSSESYVPETFHQLRVEIKKLNALAGLLEKCVSGFPKKRLLKPFNKVFKQAGKIREFQINLEFIERFNTGNHLPQLRLFMQQQIEHEKLVFFSLVNTSFLPEIGQSAQRIEPFLTKMQKKNVRILMQKEQKKITKLLSGRTIQASTLHQLRKRLKSYSYNLKIVSQPEFDLQLTDLSEMLGNWHDGQVVLQFLKKIPLTINLQEQETLELNKLLNRIDYENELLFRELLSIVIKFP